MTIVHKSSKTWISVNNRYSFICENNVTPAPAAINASKKTSLSSCAISVWLRNWIYLDMSGSFCSTMTACSPNIKAVSDQFHVGRLPNWALAQIRKKIQKMFLNCRRKCFKKSRWILLKRNHNFKTEEWLQLENMLSVSDTLRLAYDKERFFLLLDEKNSDTFLLKFREWKQLSWLLILRLLIIVQIRLASGLILLLMLVSLDTAMAMRKNVITNTLQPCFPVSNTL